MLSRGNFSCNLQRNKRCIASCENNCSCNTPFSRLAMQQNVALQVARKVELSSTFRNVARQVAACKMSSATCNVFHSSSLRCKLQEKLPRVTWPYSLRDLSPVTHFPALFAGYTFSRAFCWLHIFPFLSPIFFCFCLCCHSFCHVFLGDFSLVSGCTALTLFFTISFRTKEWATFLNMVDFQQTDTNFPRNPRMQSLLCYGILFWAYHLFGISCLSFFLALLHLF